MMNLEKGVQEDFQPFHYIDFTKASPEAILSILKALDEEVTEALAHRRFPSLDRAFERLGSVGVSMVM